LEGFLTAQFTTASQNYRNTAVELSKTLEELFFDDANAQSLQKTLKNILRAFLDECAKFLLFFRKKVAWPNLKINFFEFQIKLKI